MANAQETVDSTKASNQKPVFEVATLEGDVVSTLKVIEDIDYEFYNVTYRNPALAGQGKVSLPVKIDNLSYADTTQFLEFYEVLPNSGEFYAQIISAYR